MHDSASNAEWLGMLIGIEDFEDAPASPKVPREGGEGAAHIDIDIGVAPPRAPRPGRIPRVATPLRTAKTGYSMIWKRTFLCF